MSPQQKSGVLRLDSCSVRRCLQLPCAMDTAQLGEQTKVQVHLAAVGGHRQLAAGRLDMQGMDTPVDGHGACRSPWLQQAANAQADMIAKKLRAVDADVPLLHAMTCTATLAATSAGAQAADAAEEAAAGDP